MPKYIWQAIWALSLMVVGLANVAMYRQSADELHGKVWACLSNLHHSVGEALQFAKQESLALAPELIAAHGDVEHIRTVLVSQINNGKGLVRFAWLNSRNDIKVSSVAGIMNYGPNLSERDYVKHARRHPMQPMIAKVVQHAIRKKPVLIIATGILDAKKTYLGTLNATMNFDPLIEHIHNSMKFCPSLYRVETPHHERVTSRGNQTWLRQSDAVIRLGKAGAQFVVSGAVDPKELHTLWVVAGARTAVMMVMVSGIIGLIYWMVQWRFIRPMEVALRSIDVLVNGHHAAPPSRLNSRLEAMQRLVEMFETMQHQMDDSRKQLNMAKQHVAQMVQQQAEFFQATSAELGRAYNTIAAYSDYLEDQILLQSLKADVRYDFDDVTEMGIALRQLSDDYVRLCHVTPPREQKHQAALTDAKRAAVSVSQSVANMITDYAVMIERRNLHVISTLDDETLTASDAWSVAAMQAILLLLIQHARDESHLEIRAGEQGALIVVLSAFRQSMLPITAQDFSDFIPSMQRDVRGEIEAYLNRHAFVMIAQSYLAIAAKILRVEVDEKGGVRLVIE